jgi:hypothetical protein
MFIGVRGKKFEHAMKMYSGNKKDKGKFGYTLVTCFDTLNKLPMDFKVPLVHEPNAAPGIIKEILEWEREGKIIIELFVFDALYLNKKIFDLVSGHRFILRAPAHERLLGYVDKSVKKGQKEIILWGHSITLHWRPSKEKKEEIRLLISSE